MGLQMPNNVSTKIKKKNKINKYYSHTIFLAVMGKQQEQFMMKLLCRLGE